MTALPYINLICAGLSLALMFAIADSPWAARYSIPAAVNIIAFGLAA